MLVLIVVEVTDLVFAVDSIPAIFGVTTDRFIVYTSNVFAILGSAHLLFLLAGVVEKFHYLKVGLGIVLGFIGVKMLLPLIVKDAGGRISRAGIRFTAASRIHGARRHSDRLALGIVALVLLASVAASLIWPKPKSKEAEAGVNTTSPRRVFPAGRRSARRKAPAAIFGNGA